MNAKKKRLGRGLDALISQSLGAPRPVTDKPQVQAPNHESNEAVSSTDAFVENEDSPDGGNASANNMPADALTGESIVEVSLEKLQEGRYQPRMQMGEDALQQLADSIRAQGILQPILLRKAEDGQYEILAGHRRCKAAEIAGLVSVPAIIRDIPDQAAMAVALIENIQREDLNPIEEARGMHRLIDEFGLTHLQVGEYVGRSRSQVTNLLRLLNLSSQARVYLEKGLIDMGHARALLALERDRQDDVAMTMAEKKMSVREAEALVKSITSEDKPTRAIRGKQRDYEIEKLEQDLSEKLAAQVQIKHGVKKGQLIIHYHGLDELDGILAKIK